MRRAIVGLGNPGSRYRDTRHNIGFRIVEALAERLSIPLAGRDWGAVWGEGEPADLGRLLLVKPQTYMNRSGEVVRELMSELGLHAEEILVVHDELDFPLGRIKLKRDGGAGGHRGIDSIARELGRGNFRRLRIGIGRPPQGRDPGDFVLTAFSPDEQGAVAQLVESGVEAALRWLELGIDAAMNAVNATRPPAVEGGEDGC